MADQAKNESKPTKEKKNQQPTYWERVIKGKGTVAEPWPTAEELWNDPEVKDAIDTHNELVKNKALVKRGN